MSQVIMKMTVVPYPSPAFTYICYFAEIPGL